MPPRWACVLILLCWLAVNGWLFWHDLLPRLLPGQPPAYGIDLLEEVQDRRWMRPVNWTVYHNGEKALAAKTRVEHTGREVFDLVAEYQPVAGKRHVPIDHVLVKQMSSTYRVNSAGDLLHVAVELHGRPRSPVLRAIWPTDFHLDIRGEVRGGQFAPTARATLPDGRQPSLRLPTVEVRRGGAVLLPLHPVNRLRGLSPGQRWTMAVFDPIVDSVNAALGGGGPRLLVCRVRPEVEHFSHGRRNGVPCLVIDYEGDDYTGTTHVARDTGLVLAQESVLGKNTWAMYRD